MKCLFFLLYRRLLIVGRGIPPEKHFARQADQKSAALVSGLKWIRPAQMLARREELELGPFQ